MSAIANRYARVFVDVVLEKNLDRSKTLQDLATMARLIENSKELRRVWQNPSIEAAKKRKVLDRIVTKIDASKILRNFVAVLIDRRRISTFLGITQAVEMEFNRRMGLNEAEVTSAMPLAEIEKHALEGRISELTGKQILAHYKTDPSLLGGAVVKIGSTVYDGSIIRELEKLRHQISSC